MTLRPYLSVIKNGRIILPEDDFSGDLIFNDKVLSLSADGDADRRISGKIIRSIDASGLIVSPGFIDIHIHGCRGYDVMDCTRDAIEGICVSLPESGVTSFLPTTMSVSQGRLADVLRVLRSSIRGSSQFLSGSRILGVHLEGPFLNPARAGAQKSSEFSLPDYGFIEDFIDIIKIVTLAPELRGSSFFIEKLIENGIIPSIGHSAATYEETIEAIELGIKGATHLCNGMSPLGHRKPGVTGAALDRSLYCELIADMTHIHPAMLRLVSRLLGPERIILITDAMRGAMLPDGVYDIGGQPVQVKDRVVCLRCGTLAGSVLRLNAAVFNMVSCGALSIVDSIRAASFNPASYLGIQGSYGSLSPGCFADILLLDPEKFEVLGTFIGGIPVFLSEKIKGRICNI